MVFRLLRRGDSQTAKAQIDAGWTARLHGLGRAIDEYGTVMRDVAITTTGHDIWITGYEWRDSRYRSEWISITLRVEDHAAEYVSAAPTGVQDQSLLWGTSKRVVPWIQRLRALGHILEESRPVPKDVVILEVDDGFVVQGLCATQNPHDPWGVITLEIDGSTIAATIQRLQPAKRVRVMRLRQLA